MHIVLIPTPASFFKSFFFPGRVWERDQTFRACEPKTWVNTIFFILLLPRFGKHFVPCFSIRECPASLCAKIWWPVCPCLSSSKWRGRENTFTPSVFALTGNLSGSFRIDPVVFHKSTSKTSLRIIFSNWVMISGKSCCWAISQSCLSLLFLSFFFSFIAICLSKRLLDSIMMRVDIFAAHGSKTWQISVETT